MKNDNRLVEFTIFILLITIIAISLVSGTFAKYTSSVSGSSTATVAKWAVKVGDVDATQAHTVTFDLFKVVAEGGVYDLKGVTDSNNLSEVTGTVDDDVVKKDGKVAPGTWGKVAFEVANESDVKANYAITINSLATDLPLQFSKDGKEWKTVSEIKAVMTDTNPYSFAADTLDIGSSTAQKATATLYWKWDFNGDDVIDTTVGTDETKTCEITAGVTFTQVD